MKLNKLFLFVILTTALVVVSCGKNTEPKRFEKIITEGSWRVGKAQFNKQNKTTVFSNYVFHFMPNKDIKIYGVSDTISGAWSRGNDKRPLIFYMSFSQSYPAYIPLDDDWEVTYLTKDEFKLWRNDNNVSEDEIIFRRKG